MPQAPKCRRCGTHHWSTQRCPADKGASIAPAIREVLGAAAKSAKELLSGAAVPVPPGLWDEVRADLDGPGCSWLLVRPDGIVRVPVDEVQKAAKAQYMRELRAREKGGA